MVPVQQSVIRLHMVLGGTGKDVHSFTCDNVAWLLLHDLRHHAMMTAIAVCKYLHISPACTKAHR